MLKHMVIGKMQIKKNEISLYAYLINERLENMINAKYHSGHETMQIGISILEGNSATLSQIKY